MFAKTILGDVVKPRGIEIRESRNLTIEFSPEEPFMSFADRKYDVGYFKKEMCWKLGASKYDESIKQHAKMWESVQNPDGTFNSNYGQYWFGEQNGMMSVVMELIRDKDSRRAVIPMLSKEHMTPQTVDIVCTECVGFMIRENTLYMTVHMRSSDQIFGLGTDIPTFSFLYRLVYGLLSASHLGLKKGSISITAMSSHIYSRHYDMVNKIVAAGMYGFEPVTMPWCEAPEAMAIVAGRGKYTVVWGYDLMSWLL